MCQRYFIRVKAATNYSKFGVGRQFERFKYRSCGLSTSTNERHPCFHTTASNFGVAGVGNNISTFGLAERDTNNQMMTLNCVYATNSMSTGTIYQVEANGNTNASMDFNADCRIFKMKITDAKYMKNQNGDNASIFFTMDGKQYSVLNESDSTNKYYLEIKRLVDAKELTIKEATNA